jgi:NAD(P)-dependent dehydrogenase (short-subunit alcohol dehydrogenase family)
MGNEARGAVVKVFAAGATGAHGRLLVPLVCVRGAVLITGATDGVGEGLARRLVQRGARVIVHGRSRERAEAAVERIGGGEIAIAELASFAQVRTLVDEVATRFGELGGLVNNAGLGYNTAPPPGRRTEDGHEPTWQVNFLSAFLLTLGLQEVLAAGRGRVVHMSSGVHSSGSVDLDQPDEPRYATPYAQSKIALVMLASRASAGGGGASTSTLAAPAGSPPRWAVPAAAHWPRGSTPRCGCSPTPGSPARPGGSSGSDTRKSPTRKSKMATPGHDSGSSPSGPSRPPAGFMVRVACAKRRVAQRRPNSPPHR